MFKKTKQKKQYLVVGERNELEIFNSLNEVKMYIEREFEMNELDGNVLNQYFAVFQITKRIDFKSEVVTNVNINFE